MPHLNPAAPHFERFSECEDDDADDEAVAISGFDEMDQASLFGSGGGSGGGRLGGSGGGSLSEALMTTVGPRGGDDGGRVGPRNRRFWVGEVRRSSFGSQQHVKGRTRGRRLASPHNEEEE